MPRRIAKPWAKLDFDWFEDEAVMLLESENARDALDWAKLIGMWADFPDARMELQSPGVMLKVKTKLKRSEKSLLAYLDRLAALGLIVPELWEESMVVTNARAAEDARKRQGQREGGSRGGSGAKSNGG